MDANVSRRTGGRPPSGGTPTARRDRLAAALGVDAAALGFATDLGEAVVPAVRAQIAAAGRRRVVLAATEGAEMREAVALLSDGAEIVEAPVRPEGRIDLDRLSELMGTPTAAVVVAAADPRTGVVAPLAEVVGLARAHGAMVVTDATQLPGRYPCDLPTLGADLVLFGQRGPAGTEGPVAVIAAGQDSLAGSSGVTGEPPADAVEALADGLIAAIEAEAPEAGRLAALRDRFETTVIARIPGVDAMGASVPRLPNTTLLRFIGVDADVLAKLMPALVGYGVGEGLGSERAGVRRVNHGLHALGLREDQAHGCVTFSLHPGTSEGDVDVAVGALVEAVRLARSVTLGGNHGE